MKEIMWKELKSDLFTAKGYLWYVLASVILSVLSYLFLTNIELSLLDQSTMVFYIMEAVLSLGILRAIIYGSDSFAGESERGTMEVLLLTPLRKSSIALEKFEASIVNWFILFLISIPYILIVGKGGQNVFDAIFYLFFLGTLMVMIFMILSMILSIRLKSVKNALVTGMLIFFLLGMTMISPTLFKQSYIGQYIDAVNPVAAAVNTFDSVVIDSEGFGLQIARVSVIIFYLILITLSLRRTVQKDELLGGVS
jgi:ABC-2 type transport system permease protein